ncbi:hypothetical protein HMSSN036_79310 [Paenibacillus macerans]|nr:hypothetical protein HMSSN036_79310 [Paenibacillus macerans]
MSLFYSREINKCAVYKDENSLNSVIFKFNFLDPQDWVVIDILHTGEDGYPIFLGSIKGMKDKIRNRGLAPYPIIEITTKKTKIISILIWFVSLAFSSLLVAGVLYLCELLTGEISLYNKNCDWIWY